MVDCVRSKGNEWGRPGRNRVGFTLSRAAPDETLEAQTRVEQIRAVLDAVEVRTREIYFAHRAGYGYAEIATHMKISQRAVKRHVARALLAIMEHVEKERGARTSDASRGG
jgi:DNA-directed RNA polymerase specialized sigma24 family protein